MSMQLRSIGSSSCRTERNHPATRFPTFSLGCVFPQAARISFCKTNPDLILQNQPGSHSAKPTRISFCKTNPDPIWLWLDVRFWPDKSGPEASRCARINRPASGQRFQAGPDRMGIGSAVFTGRTRHATAAGHATGVTTSVLLQA